MNTSRFAHAAWLSKRAMPVIAALLGACVGASSAWAAATDVANVPLSTSSQTLVKPNIMFILDDSGSMARSYMPDDAGFAIYKYGRFASQCNGLAYNPTTKYSVPVDAAGVALADGSFTAPSPTTLTYRHDVTSSAPSIATTSSLLVTLNSTDRRAYSTNDVVTLYSNDDPTKLMVGRVNSWNRPTLDLTIYYAQGSGTLTNPRIRDSDNRAYYYTYSGSQTALNYLYSGTGVDTSTTFYSECSSDVGSTTGSAVFTRVDFASLSSLAAINTPQNYANWYTYYRTRMLMMKSSAALAFKSVDTKFRVGFTTISSLYVDGDKFLDIKDFDTTQKGDFYTALNAATPDSYTPLRGALAKAGQYYAKKGKKTDGSAQTYDPMQYSCQRNYTLLTTDGYWNTDIETSSYGPFKLDASTAVGQQDGAGTDRPMKDAEVSTTTKRTSSLQSRSVTAQFTQATSALQTRSITPQFTRSVSQLQSQTIVPQFTRVTRQLQSRSVVPQFTQGTRVLLVQTGQLQQRTTANGNSGSPTWTAWSNTGSCQWDNNGNDRRQCQYVWGAVANAVGACATNENTNSSHGSTWSGNGTRCTYSAPTNTTVSSCTAVPASPSSPFTVLTAVTCTDTSAFGAWTNVSSCTASTNTQCQYAAPVTTTVASCTAVPASPSSPYTVGLAVTCTDISTYGPWTNAASCTTSSTLGCRYATPTTSTVSSCTPVTASPGSPFTVSSAVTCTPLAPLYGAWTNTGTCTDSASAECRYAAPVTTTVAACTPITASPGSPYTVPSAVTCTPTTPLYGTWTNAASCTTSSTNECQYTAWSSWSTVGVCTAAAQSAGSPFTVGTAVECGTTTSSGSTDTLADVAMYYYNTDLRASTLSNCSVTFKDANGNTVTNNVCGEEADSSNPTQRMSTLTLGMGVSGTLRYSSTYKTDGSGDFYDIKQGTKDWPTPSADSATAVDDLWHAAVNGRGTYFSASNPTSLAASLASALTEVTAKVGYGSAAAASTLQPVAGDNSLYLAQYMSVFWIGDLVRYTINPDTGAVTGPDWSAASKLQARVNAGTARNIYYFKGDTGFNTGTLRSFTYANLTLDGLNGLFDGACSKTITLAQCTIGGYDTTYINAGANMVSYLRGAQGSATTYRVRKTDATDISGGVLGDVIGGAPVFVGKPTFKYTENAYATWAASKSSRQGVVYLGANDGMLHAFDGANGEEKWAYIPSMVMDKMYRIADSDWANSHQFFVNAPPVVGDVFVSGVWKTILVGGLGAGGQGYYALDITDPDNPVALWEFSNAAAAGGGNMGLSFGNPVITKRSDGKWVVVFTSGYNNTAGDGNGHLYVVDAGTGARVLDIPTNTSVSVGAGSTSTPSGLGKLNAWVESEIDNSALRFYAGDLLGNLWRFDIDNRVAPNQAALRLAQFQVGGVGQPITTKPELAAVTHFGSKYPVVYVATGKYLGTGDLTDTTTQSIYALKDPLTNTPLGDVRTSSDVIAQTMSLVSGNRSVTASTVDWSTKSGWRLDLLTGGERVSVDPALVYDTLNVASILPSSDACDAGGKSYLYQLAISNGALNAPVTSYSEVVMGMSWYTLTGAKKGTFMRLVGNKTGLQEQVEVPKGDTNVPEGRRTSWRELVN